MTARRIVRLAAALALMAGVAISAAACGSDSDGAEVKSGSAPQVSKVPLDQAMAKNPVARPGAVPHASDDAHIWMSDFTRLATYSVADETWTSIPLPWPTETIDGLLLGSAHGQLVAVANLCDGSCEERAGDGAAPVRATPFTVVDDEVKPIGDPAPVIEGLNQYGWISTGGDTLQARYSSGRTGGFVLDVSPHGTKTTAYAAHLVALCPTADGYAGLEVVDADQPGAVPWGPLPNGWTPDPHDAERFVTGTGTGSLKAAVLPAAARPVLADWTQLATMCIPGGLAIVGPHDAWEYADGTWMQRPSSMTNPMQNEDAGAPERLGDRTLIGQVPSGVLHRAVDGSWTTTGTGTIQLGVGDHILAYVRPTVPATGN